MCAYQFIYTTKLNQLTESEFVYGVPNLVFYFKFKCYNFPGFGMVIWTITKGVNCVCVCVCNLMYIVSIYAKLQTHT